MIDLEVIKTKISDGKIDSYVESYLEISDQIDNLENKLREGNLEAKKMMRYLRCMIISWRR